MRMMTTLIRLKKIVLAKISSFYQNQFLEERENLLAHRKAYR